MDYRTGSIFWRDHAHDQRDFELLTIYTVADHLHLSCLTRCDPVNFPAPFVRKIRKKFITNGRIRRREHGETGEDAISGSISDACESEALGRGVTIVSPADWACHWHRYWAWRSLFVIVTLWCGALREKRTCHELPLICQL